MTDTDSTDGVEKIKLGLLLRQHSTAKFDENETLQGVAEAQLELIHKHHQFTPQANLYKCWAINLFRNRMKLKVFTFLVLFIQVIGTFIILDYCRRQWKTRDPVASWQYLRCLYEASNQTHHNEFWWLYDDHAMAFISSRIIGGVFILVIWFQNNESLLALDLESHNFVRYFPQISVKAKVMDIFTSCWSMTIIGLCQSTIYECKGNDLFELLMDAVALLFVAQLDNFEKTGAFFGYDAREFDGIVDKFRDIYLEKLETKEQNLLEDEKGLPLHSHFVTLTRVMCGIIMSIQLPLFIGLKLEPQEGEGSELNCSSKWNRDGSLGSEIGIDYEKKQEGFLDKFCYVWEFWFFSACVLVFGNWAYRTYKYLKGRHKYFEAERKYAEADSEEDEEDRLDAEKEQARLCLKYEVDKFDWKGGLTHIIMRRPDPRFQRNLLKYFATEAMKDKEKEKYFNELFERERRAKVD